MIRRHSNTVVTILVAVLLLTTGSSLAASLTPDQKAVVRDTNRLAFAMFHALRQGDGNIVLGPYSLAQVLAMTRAGASGETERQIREATGLSLPQARLHSAFRELRQLLESRQSEGCGLRTAASLWGQSDSRFLAPYLTTVTRCYGASAHPISFKNGPEQARQTISQWLGEHQYVRGDTLLPAGLISRLTRMVLVSSSHFHGVWKHGFDPAVTGSGRFSLGSGGTIDIPMMTRAGQLSYYRDQGYQMIELPFRDDHRSMLIILPDAGELATVESALQPEWISSAGDAMSPTSLVLQLPRFSCSTAFQLQPALAAIGMPVAFTDDADFSGINGCRDLTLEDVVHQATLTVKEEGAEVAAGSGSVIRLKKGPSRLTIDRPFLFLIRDRETGMVLLLGRVSNPSTAEGVRF
jgi:serpin B